MFCVCQCAIHGSVLFDVVYEVKCIHPTEVLSFTDFLGFDLLQVTYSPRRSKNVSLTHGEGVERFWSFLRMFSPITKEMSVHKRNDALTDASIHYGENLVAKYGNSCHHAYLDMSRCYV